MVFVAVRLWAAAWHEKRACIAVKSDNMAALVLLRKLKSKASGLIARELAMTMSKEVVQPRVVTHVPGMMNFIPDGLSRQWDPQYRHGMPSGLPMDRQVQVPPRGREYYCTLPPMSGRGA